MTDDRADNATNSLARATRRELVATGAAVPLAMSMPSVTLAAPSSDVAAPSAAAVHEKVAVNLTINGQRRASRSTRAGPFSISCVSTSTSRERRRAAIRVNAARVPCSSTEGGSTRA